MTHKKIAVITARGGSKRIPRKNIKLFLGVPIIKYSIDAALQSNCFDEVMVSTDDKEIADIAIALGAKVPFFRSDSISDDYASTADVLKEVIFEYKKMGANFEYLCCIYPTAPLIQINHLRNGLSQLITHNFSSIVPVVKFGYPIWRSVSIDQ
ncbi:MAG: acylneuraminate cytidylyltransferase, partial [Chitinophagaceae bacterium]|nr:acylneuraminate cytidylyltransferase [Chitinophagaceae bacterium]